MVCLVKVNYISLHVVASHLAIWPLIFELEGFFFFTIKENLIALIFNSKLKMLHFQLHKVMGRNTFKNLSSCNDGFVEYRSLNYC